MYHPLLLIFCQEHEIDKLTTALYSPSPWYSLIFLSTGPKELGLFEGVEGRGNLKIDHLGFYSEFKVN